MSTDRLYLEQVLRPVRLAYLMDLGCPEQIDLFVQLSTALWGGRYNPIVPAEKRGDGWVIDDTILSAIRGAFSPDYFVLGPTVGEAPPELPTDRTIAFDKIADRKSGELLGFGLDVRNAYNEFYRQFVEVKLKDPIDVALPAEGEHRRLLSFVMGALPPEGQFEWVGRTYKELLTPRRFNFDAGLIVNGDGVPHPLEIGRWGISVEPLAWSGLDFMLVDESKVTDLIALWNARAFGRDTIPIPAAWNKPIVEGMTMRIRDELKYFGPRGDGQSRFVVRVVGADRAESAAELIKSLDPEYARHVRPSIASVQSSDTPTPEFAREVSRIRAAEHAEYWPVRDGEVEFRDLRPPMEIEEGRWKSPKWTNVVRVMHRGLGSDTVGNAVPDISDLHVDLGTRGHDVWSTGEGFVVPENGASYPHSWYLPTHDRILQAWLRERELEAEVSDAGHVCRQMVRKLGGIPGVDKLLHPDLIALINKLAAREHEIPVKEADPRRRSAKAKYAPRQEFMKVLRAWRENDRASADESWRELVRAGILVPGLRLQCDRCFQHQWVGVDELASSMVCSRCLDSYSFPAERPPTLWSYQPVGPFSVENFARGAYSVILALRFLSQGMLADLAWWPSTNLRPNGEQPLEADFLAFRARNEPGFRTWDSELVVGECKSFNEFEAEDIDRLGRLTRVFPEATLVLSTLRRDLTADERRMIRDFIAANEFTRVMVLTAWELFGTIGPPSCWSDHPLGGDDLVRAYRSNRGTSVVCGLTHRLHLAESPE